MRPTAVFFALVALASTVVLAVPLDVIARRDVHGTVFTHAPVARTHEAENTPGIIEDPPHAPRPLNPPPGGQPAPPPKPPVFTGPTTGADSHPPGPPIAPDPKLMRDRNMWKTVSTVDPKDLKRVPSFHGPQG
ncbi:hypothetical protein EIP91_009116 [Steccherinum ochraceum]|uniref:Uncharacterized protein n=1 Tax=Steccherinum ochraceum TaxID=92696 RepID=A0A4R0RA83_9APHY|nr:hypothetical protein EIP91_009116 [Steccherinum ochraceum]